jgi:hypothetical protein
MGFTEPDSAPAAPPQLPASTWDIQAPYAPGMPQPISTAGAADAGGQDTVAGTVDGAVASAKARFGELQGDTYGQGSTIGDTYDLPAASSTGATGGAYYDPPRDYGD